MIKYGVVGTSWITETFIDAASHVRDLKLNAVYSRNEKRAKEFAQKYNVDNVFTDMNEMAKSDVMNAIYIASPNALHAEHSKIF